MAWVKSSRPVGRPKKGSEEFFATRENLRKVEVMYLQCTPVWKIAKTLGCSEATIDWHIKHTIKPQWEKEVRGGREDTLKKMERIEEVAWREFEKSLTLGGIEDAEVVEEALKKAKLSHPVVTKLLQKLSKVGDKEWLKVLLACIDWRSKLGGWYTTKVESEVTLRVAGTPRDEMEKQMLERIVEKLRAREQAVTPN